MKIFNLFLVKENKRLLLLTSILFILALFSISFFGPIDTKKSALATSSELGFVGLSPNGTEGGEIVPASCESGYEHFSGECGTPCWTYYESNGTCHVSQPATCNAYFNPSTTYPNEATTYYYSTSNATTYTTDLWGGGSDIGVGPGAIPAASGQTLTVTGYAYGPDGWNSCAATLTIVPAPVLGCTNSNATNYNASANQDDGSCTYLSIGSVTINASTVQPNGSTQYTITHTASDPGGGGNIADAQVIINYQGPNANPPSYSNARGIIRWSTGNLSSWPIEAPVSPTSGGGYCGVYNGTNAGGWGYQYIDLVSCNTSVSGNTRTTQFVVTFPSSFTAPATSNTLSGYANRAGGTPYAGWTPSGTFNLPLPTVTSTTISPTPVVANGFNAYTITQTSSDSFGANAIGNQLVTINYQGPNAPTYRGYLGWSHDGSFPHFVSNVTSVKDDEPGPGKCGVYNGPGWDPQYINLISCSNTSSGNSRTTQFVVSFNTSFTTPTTNNTLSGYASRTPSAGGAGSGWVADGTFNLSAATCSSSNTVGTYSTGTGPRSSVYDPSTNSIWVSNESSNNVTKLNAATGATIGTYTVGTAPRIIEYDPSTSSVWVANFGNNNVTKLNAATGATIGTYSVGTGPRGVAFDSSSNSIWVSNQTSNNVTKLNAATGAVIGTYAAGTAPYVLAYDSTNNAIWVTNNTTNVVTKINAATGATINTYAAGAAPFGIVHDPSTNSMWITNQSSNVVTKINAANGSTIGSYSAGAAGSGPFGITYDPSTASIWITNANNNRVTKLAASTGAILGMYCVGSNPNSITYDPSSHVWATNQFSNNITKIYTGTTLSSPIVATCSASNITPTTLDPVDWTASGISGGSGTYTYQWQGDTPLQGVVTNPATVTYSSGGLKTGSVKIFSTGAPNSGATFTCSNSPINVTLATPPDFTLDVGPTTPVNNTTNRAIISPAGNRTFTSQVMVPTTAGGFNGNVTIQFLSATTNLGANVPAAVTFPNGTTINSSEYATGKQVKMVIPLGTTGSYVDFNYQATSGAITKTDTLRIYITAGGSGSGNPGFTEE